jgi:nucleotide-binding universal stress UspA family protein
MTEHRVVTVGVDGSEASSAALGWAAREANLRGATLRVVHSFAVPVYAGDYAGTSVYSAVDVEALRASCLKTVEAQLVPVRRDFHGLAIETQVEPGWPTALLVERSKDADMVVAGSHGSGSLAALFLGSVAHHIAHKAPCAAVLVPNGTLAPSIRHVVVGTDGSAAADNAVGWARREAAIWGAKLTIVHSWDYPYLDVGTPPRMMEAAEGVLNEAAASMEKPDETPVLVEAKLVQGTAAVALIDESSTADLLVVGARGRGALRAALLGSTSSYAIQHAQCPVVVVHATSK